MSKLSNAESLFRRAKDSSDPSLLIKGMVEFLDSLPLDVGPDLRRAKQILRSARQKKDPVEVQQLIAEAFWFLTKELSK